MKSSWTPLTPRPVEPVRLRRRQKPGPGRVSAREWMFRLVALTLATLFAGLIVELGCRLLGPRDNREWGDKHPLWHHWYQKNHTQVVYDDNGEFGGHVAHFNSEGFAMRDELPAAGTPALLCLGDSFTAGLEVPEDDRFASKLGKSLQLPVLNFGCGSFSPLLSRIQLEHFAGRISPRVVVLEVSPNDVEGDYAKSRIARRNTTGHIVAVPDERPLSSLVYRSQALRMLQFAYRGWRFERMMRAKAGPDWKPDPWSPYFTKPLEDWFTIPERRVIEESVGEISDICRKHQWPLFLLPVPDRGAVLKGQTDHFREFCLQMARRLQLPVIDLDPEFRVRDVTELFFSRDGHFTSAGHAVAAEALARALEPVLAATATGQTAAGTVP